MLGLQMNLRFVLITGDFLNRLFEIDESLDRDKVLFFPMRVGELDLLYTKYVLACLSAFYNISRASFNSYLVRYA
jgi:hypothetical protein